MHSFNLAQIPPFPLANLHGVCGENAGIEMIYWRGLKTLGRAL